MKLSAYRKARGLSQKEMAEELGLSRNSKGWICEIEGGTRDASLSLALKIEAWSGGKVPAASVCKAAAALGASAKAA